MYKFVVENVSIRIHMKKIKSHKVSNTFAPWGTWLAVRSVYVPLGQMGLSCLRSKLVPRGTNLSETLYDFIFFI
jgi:hypothetical protein